MEVVQTDLIHMFKFYFYMRKWPRRAGLGSENKTILAFRIEKVKSP